MRLPTATYRLQFRGGFTLHDAAELVPYLAALGVSHVYASPIFAATPGSTHGYDVADFNQIDPTIGGMEGFEKLALALEDSGLGLILDFVPNHMGATPFNPWWRDILEWGQESDYREHFDIDWSAPKLVVPTLGEPYGEALRKRLFGLEIDARDGGISFTYHDLRLPLTPPSYARILGRIEADPLPELARRFAVARPETAGAAKEELAALVRQGEFRMQIIEAIAATLGDVTALHELHEAQVWRASYWRAAREGLTYRRFFEIADLVGVRVERPRVFDDVHALLRELAAKGHVQGIRLDHIDGLADPKTYLQRLQEALGGDEPSYLLVEKILGPGETLRPSWPVAGTTGYEFIQALAGLFVDPDGEVALTEAYEAFLGGRVDYPTMVRETKRRILARNLAGELEFLKDLAKSLAERDPSTRDYGADSLRRAILEFAAALPVYRTYVNVEGPDETDRALIAAAVEAVKAAREVEDEGAIAFVERMLTLDFPDPEMQGAALVFTERFQQTTGPVMAKALEDTVFYRYNRLIALNEVGGEPEHFGAPVEAFQDAMQARLATQPSGLSATATHDTKRGEDARARLYAISEMPEAWPEAVAAWSGMLAGHRIDLDGGPAPEPEMEWLFYQALAGVWPADLDTADEGGTGALAERMEAYVLKVVREAKARTSWTAPAAEYEQAVSGFVRAALSNKGFIADFVERTAPVRLAGAVTSLAQLAIKLAAPGVPDIYQGTELWDLSLVDPDNRRPVDFALRSGAAAEIDPTPPDGLLRDWRSGRPKLRLMRAGLTLRRERPELFAEGEYVPLEIKGECAGHAVAFARHRGEEVLVLIATRLPLALLGESDVPLVDPSRWDDTRVVLPADARGAAFRDIVSGETLAGAGEISLASALARFPATLLHGTGKVVRA
jgi:(1->4)-alpha-D-glucan 1-alpha-D-glucosylmutase